MQAKPTVSNQNLMLIVIIALATALLGSLLMTYRTYQMSKQYEHFFSANLLDPFNLNLYPASAESVAAQAMATNERLVVFFGDSRALEWPAPTYDNPQWQFINRGINAQTSVQAAGRYQYHIGALEPDVVVVQVGVNDLRLIPLFSKQREQIVANAKTHIDEIVAQATTQGTTVVLSTIFPVGKPSLEQKLTGESVAVITAVREVNKHIRSLASKQVIILDAETLVGNSSGSIVRADYREDFLHINRKGYDVLNQELMRLLATVN